MIILTSTFMIHFFLWLSDGWRYGGSEGYQTRNDMRLWIMTSSLKSIHGFHWWWINIQYLYSFQPPDGVNGADKYESVSDILLQALIISLRDTAGHGSCRRAGTRISSSNHFLQDGEDLHGSCLNCGTNYSLATGQTKWIDLLQRLTNHSDPVLPV